MYWVSDTGDSRLLFAVLYMDSSISFWVCLIICVFHSFLCSGVGVSGGRTGAPVAGGRAVL